MYLNVNLLIVLYFYIGLYLFISKPILWTQINAVKEINVGDTKQYFKYK